MQCTITVRCNLRKYFVAEVTQDGSTGWYGLAPLTNWTRFFFSIVLSPRCQITQYCLSGLINGPAPRVTRVVPINNTTEIEISVSLNLLIILLT